MLLILEKFPTLKLNFDVVPALMDSVIDYTNGFHDIHSELTVMDVEAGEMININGMDVLIFEQEKKCTIIYRDNLTDYYIYLECDFETAKEFAKTIK